MDLLRRKQSLRNKSALLLSPPLLFKSFYVSFPFHAACLVQVAPTRAHLAVSLRVRALKSWIKVGYDAGDGYLGIRNAHVWMLSDHSVIFLDFPARGPTVRKCTRHEINKAQKDLDAISMTRATRALRNAGDDKIWQISSRSLYFGQKLLAHMLAQRSKRRLSRKKGYLVELLPAGLIISCNEANDRRRRKAAIFELREPYEIRIS